PGVKDSRAAGFDWTPKTSSATTRPKSGATRKRIESGLRFSALRINGFRGLKTDLAMRAVAERLVRRRSTPAERDLRSIVSRNLVSGGVVDINRTFDEVRSIW